jgi:hypothetical protein
MYFSPATKYLEVSLKWIGEHRQVVLDSYPAGTTARVDRHRSYSSHQIEETDAIAHTMVHES